MLLFLITHDQSLRMEMFAWPRQFSHLAETVSEKLEPQIRFQKNASELILLGLMLQYVEVFFVERILLTSGYAEHTTMIMDI